MEAGKCYKIFFPDSHDIYIFKIREIKREKYYIFNNVTLYSNEVKIYKGFKQCDSKIERMIDTAFPEPYIVQEVEEKDIDKLEHYYKMMENAFNAIINKYK